MKTDDFEQELRRQPLRQLPPEWRREILQAAREARVECPEQAMSAWDCFLQWLWPCPRAWAVMAVVWMCLLCAELWPTDLQMHAAEKAFTNPSPERLMALREQLRLQHEILQPGDNSADAAPGSAQPRSNLPLTQQTA